MTTYRPGALGAMMDEYERAASELLHVLSNVSDTEYVQEVDPNATDEDCISISTIMRHVIRAGYGYANYLRELWHIKVNSPTNFPLSRETSIQVFQEMMQYTIETLQDRWELDNEGQSQTFKVRWGVTYNVEQILEHAICHILRHRRQIVKFQEKINRVTSEAV